MLNVAISAHIGATMIEVQAGVLSAAALPLAQVLRDVDVQAESGLSGEEVARRQSIWGPNAVSSHRARFLPVVWHQLRSPLLALLLIAAVASYFVGERGGAVIIAIIVALSVGLGFVNEYRAEKAAEALHSQIHHEGTVIRDGQASSVDVVDLVPGDILELRLGDIVAADIRLIEVNALQCDESVLTGESLPVEKTTEPTAPGTALAELTGCALMGTIVHGAPTRSTPSSRSGCANSPCCSYTSRAR
jgi:Mg2+-importing ATPase